MSPLSLVSLPFLPISLMPTPRVSPTLGSWCHLGLPGKLQAFEALFLAASWWLWLPTVYQEEERKEASQWKGQKTSSRHAFTRESCESLVGSHWLREEVIRKPRCGLPETISSGEALNLVGIESIYLGDVGSSEPGHFLGYLCSSNSPIFVIS